MSTKIKFFAQLRELLECSQIEVTIDAPLSVTELRSKLIEEHPNWEAHLQDGLVLQAVNQKLVKSSDFVTPGDEVAFFPPVTGG